MSKKTELQADLQRINYLLGRAHKTQESRSGTFRTFARVMRETSFGIHCAAQIGGKHLQAFVRLLARERHCKPNGRQRDGPSACGTEAHR